MNPARPPSVNSESKENTSAVTAVRAYPRTIPPFILQRDILRGLMFIGQSTLRYMLMLVVM
jgi:hypothetical protein